MKKFISFLITSMIVFSLMPISVFAADEKHTFFDGDIRYLITSENTVSVISDKDNDLGLGLGLSTYSGDIIIPETVLDEDKFYNVTGIYENTFHQNNSFAKKCHCYRQWSIL